MVTHFSSSLLILVTNFIECRQSLAFQRDRPQASHSQEPNGQLLFFTFKQQQQEKKIRDVRKRNSDLTEDSNLVLTSLGQDVFLLEASRDKRFTDGWWQTIHAAVSISSERTELIDTWKPLSSIFRLTKRNYEVFDILLILHCFLMFFG